MAFIIFTHYTWSKDEQLKMLFPFWIDMAVPALMIITGYVYSYIEFGKKGRTDLASLYNPKQIIAKLIRFLIPYILFFILDIIVFVFIQGNEKTVFECIKLFLTGGVGPGSFYVPVMIQIVLILPLVSYTCYKFRRGGVLIWFALNVLFEIVQTVVHMSDDLYRLCSLRYLLCLGTGCYFYFGFLEQWEKKESKRQLIILSAAGIVGVIYIVVYNYTDNIPIITNKWTTTSVFASLYIVPIMYFLIHHCKGLNNKVIELMGKASFNIYLVQMFYYMAFSKVIYSLFDSVPLRIIINLVSCVCVGIVYYYLEYPITKKVIKRIRETMYE